MLQLLCIQSLHISVDLPSANDCAVSFRHTRKLNFRVNSHTPTAYVLQLLYFAYNCAYTLLDARIWRDC